VIRALEHALDDRPMSAKPGTWEGEPRPEFRWVLTGLRWPREALVARIEARVHAMMAAGWLEEVRRVLATGGFSRTAGEAHGYKRLLAHLRGELTLEQALAQTIRDVKLFSRKSMTFFRRFKRVQWLDVTQEAELGRAAMYLAHELKEMLNAAGAHREMVELPPGQTPAKPSPER
jgi:tRNA dimethylallyltransferase